MTINSVNHNVIVELNINIYLKWKKGKI